MEEYAIYSPSGVYVKNVKGFLECPKFQDEPTQYKVVDENGKILAIIPIAFLIITI